MKRISERGWLAAGVPRLLCAALLFVGTVANVHAAPIGLVNMFDDYTENFDSLGLIGGTTLPAGWVMALDTDSAYIIDNGSNTSDGVRSYGNLTQADRALGSLNDTSALLIYGAEFLNSTGSTINRLDIQYMGEQWRRGNNALPDVLEFEYSTNATGVNDGAATWNPVSTLNFSSPNTTGGATRINGNLFDNRVALGETVTGLAIVSGSTFWVRFLDRSLAGEDHGLSVDNFQLTPLPATADIPEPPSGVLLAVGALLAAAVGLRRQRVMA